MDGEGANYPHLSLIIMDLSIIILNYNQKNLLKNCLKNLFESKVKLKYEIIVIDNNSTDGSKKFLSEFKIKELEFKIILNNRNNGYAKANNQGIKLAQGKYILILNPDVIVLPDSIEKLVKFLDQNPKAALVGPQLLNPDKTIQHSCYSFPRLYTPAVRRTFLGKLPGLKKELKRYLMLDFDHQKTKEVDWLLGAALMIRKEILDKIGFFDERYFLYFEDVDLARRIKQAGFKVYYFSESQMIHFHQRLSAAQASFPSLFSKITWIHIASALKYFRKWWKQKRPT